MYKVVIVDDEPMIVNGLSKAVGWAEYGCDVVGTASSGEEGLEVVKKLKPDILFSDIKMPGIDGLTMIAGLKSEHPNLEIAILSGYPDFNYARQALNLGVTRYLLKPSKMDEIREALDAMTGNLAEKGITGERSTGVTDEITDRTIDENEETEEADSGSAAGTFIVNSALKYMEDNYTSKIQLNDVADHVYVSHWHLSKLLNHNTGKSFSDLMNGIRIDKAKELMKDHSLHIVDIAEKVGFCDVAHFSRVFKKMTGMSANEYRNRPNRIS